MKNLTFPHLPIWGAVAVLALTLHGSRAADAEEPLVPPRPRPNIEELRERFRSLNPEQRQNLLREFRERRGGGATNRSEWESFREELRKLPPQEREARIQDLKRRLEVAPPQFRVLSPEERETKRKQMQERVAAQISQLRAKKAEGDLTEAEQRRLDRMEQMARRFEEGSVLAPRRPAPSAGLPAPRNANPAVPAPAPNADSSPKSTKPPQ